MKIKLKNSFMKNTIIILLIFKFTINPNDYFRDKVYGYYTLD